MPLLGTLINCALIIVGTLAGLAVKKILPEHVKNTVMQAVALVVMFVGIGGALSACLTYTDGAFGTKDSLVMILAMTLGTVVGELIDIEKHLDKLGERCQKRFVKPGAASTFAEGMVTATLLFCVGAMAVVGALDNGIRGNYDVLLAKSIIDCISALILASTLGIGVLFSAVAVLLYQGAISLLGVYIEPYLTDAVISQMSFVGSILIFAIGLRMLNIAKIKVGNLLPAVFMPILFDLVARLWGLLFG